MYLKYDVTGKITSIYTNAAMTTLKVAYSYDEAGNRISRTDNTGPQPLTTYYVYDASGNVMGIHNGSTPVLTEVPVYGSNRLGTYFVAANNYVYKLRDNVGSVRVTLNSTKNSSGQADIVGFNDYFPYGSIAQSGGTGYRYEYQGAYAEKDPVTGLNNFELRMYDAKIGRWLSVDPAGQYTSPYEGMENDPVTGIDPTGGESPIYDNITSEFLSFDSQLQGDILYGSKSLYHALSNNGTSIIDHAIAEVSFEKPSFSNITTNASLNPFGITLQALGNSYADILTSQALILHIYLIIRYL